MFGNNLSEPLRIPLISHLQFFSINSYSDPSTLVVKVRSPCFHILISIISIYPYFVLPSNFALRIDSLVFWHIWRFRSSVFRTNDILRLCWTLDCEVGAVQTTLKIISPSANTLYQDLRSSSRIIPFFVHIRSHIAISIQNRLSDSSPDQAQPDFLRY